MAHIKEPKGVDFLIQSEPLTDEVRGEISRFIKAYKTKAPRKVVEKSAVGGRKGRVVKL